MQRRVELSLLQIAATLGIIAFHSGLLEWGWVAVELFFVLAGYFTVRSCVAAGKSEKFASYFLQRLSRLLPEYFLLCAILLVLLVATGRADELHYFVPFAVLMGINFLRAFGYVFDPWYGHLWFVCALLQLQLACFILWRRVQSTTFVQWLVAVIVMTPLTRWLSFRALAYFHADPYVVADGVYWLPWTHLDAFAWGCLAWLIPATSPKKTQMWLLLSASVTGLVGCMNAWLLGARDLHAITALAYPVVMRHNAQYVWGYSLLAITAFCLLRWVLQLNPAAPAPLAKFINHWSVLTYAAYIFHGLILTGLREPVAQAKIQNGPLVLFLVTALLSFLVAALVHSLITRLRQALANPNIEKTRQPVR